MLINIEYPEKVLEIEDVRLAIEAGDKLGDMLERAVDELDNNISICTSEESGIARREKILGITPRDTASLDDRRLEVLLKWFSIPPYTERALRRKLDSALGAGNYVLTIDLDKKLVSCQIELTRRLMFQSVSDMLEQMIPLDYLISVTLRYNQWQMFTPYTWGQLENYVWEQLREGVLIVE